MSIEIQAALYYYDLGLLKRENHLYCLVDLKASITRTEGIKNAK